MVSCWNSTAVDGKMWSRKNSCQKCQSCIPCLCSSLYWSGVQLKIIQTCPGVCKPVSFHCQKLRLENEQVMGRKKKTSHVEYQHSANLHNRNMWRDYCLLSYRLLRVEARFYRWLLEVLQMCHRSLDRGEWQQLRILMDSLKELFPSCTLIETTG